MAIQELRDAIIEVDTELLEILKRRSEILPAIVRYKQKHNLQVTDEKREAELIQKYTTLAQEKGLNPAFVSDLYTIIFAESRRIQHALWKKVE